MRVVKYFGGFDDEDVTKRNFENRDMTYSVG